MQAVSDFFAVESHNIIVGVIVGVIVAILTSILLGLPAVLKRKIIKLLNPHPEEAEKRKQLKERIKSHTTTDDDMVYAFSLSAKKIKLSIGESQLATKYAIQMLKKIAEVDKVRESLYTEKTTIQGDQ